MHTSSITTASKTISVVAVIFILTISGWAQATEKVIYSFTGLADGGFPQSGLAIDSKGNLYGTTQNGGAGTPCSCGTVFELSPGSNGTWTESVLHSFGATGDGTSPFSQPVFDSKGNLYGTTVSGGTNFQGTVYELSPGTNGTWTETVIYNFTNGADGGLPYSTRLAIDSAGDLYGVTNAGGTYGFGVVFELIPGSNGTWTEKVLHSFTGDNDGGNPYASSLVLDSAGNLYGMARGGGAHDYGLVFGLTRSNGTWSEKVLYAFTGADGEADAVGGLLLDSKGNLYGAAYDVFELVHGSNGTWTKSVLHSFTGTPDGAYPESALISDKAGNLYGTTNSGGSHDGTVFELAPGLGGSWKERVLHRFTANGTDGVSPNSSSLAMDASGNLYGTTPAGGASKVGVVFEITR